MMASRAFLIAMIVAAAVVVAPALATDYMVGDGEGWTLSFNYTAWAEGKDFRLGDNLIFIYPPGVHNVLKVDGADFGRCTSTNSTAVPYTSGNDTIPLKNPGKKWYICDIGNHCSQGMKLAITVSAAADGPTPTPVPGSSDAGKVSPLKSSMWMLVLMAAYMKISA